MAFSVFADSDTILVFNVGNYGFEGNYPILEKKYLMRQFLYLTLDWKIEIPVTE